MDPVLLHVDGEEWRLSIAGVTPIGREIFVQLALVGPAVCTVVIRAHAIVRGVTARQILETVCEWLLHRGDARHAVLDVGGATA